MMPTFSRTIETLRHGIEASLHLGAQAYVSHNGEALLDEAVGSAAPNVPMKPDTINLWWSSSKPFAGVAIAILRERNRLDYDDAVAKHILEFGANGKDAVTIRQCLTHTAGFRAWPLKVELHSPWDQIIAAICESKLERDWTPGDKAGYHGRTAWFILAEIVRRLDGRTYDHFVREEIFEPLDMRDSWMSVPGEAYHQYAESNRFAVMCNTSKPDQPCDIPTEAEAALLHPGGSGRGPIRELGRFYEWMLREIRGESKSEIPDLKSATVQNLARTHRRGLYDHTFKHAMDWGLGFITNTAQVDVETMPYTYGRYASPASFGHSGAESSCAFCDPDRGLVIAWVCNGMPGNEAHQARQRAINHAIYEDMEL